MNAIHRTRVHARRVFGVDARLCDHISHNESISSAEWLYFTTVSLRTAYSSKKCFAATKGKRLTDRCQPLLWLK
jgi:hypothetical protein